MMDRITKLCQKPDQKPRAPLIAYTHEHIDQIAREAQASEKHAPLPDFLRCRQAQRDDAFLHSFIIQMHHTDGAVSNTDRADQVQQEAQTKAFQNEL
jgi:hypothetical protein